MTRAVQHVGVPGYEFQTGVMWDGGVVVGSLAFLELNVMKQEVAPLGNNRLHLSVGYGETMKFFDRRGAGNPAIRRWLEEGRLPIPFGGKIDLDLQVAKDGNSIAVNMKLSNLAVKPREIRVRLRSGDGRPLAWAEVNGQKRQVLEGDTMRLP